MENTQPLNPKEEESKTIKFQYFAGVLPDEFFNIIAITSGLRSLLSKHFCTGNLAKQLNDYKIEGNSFRNYYWQAWKLDNQELIKKAREEIEVNELNEESIKLLKWESISKEIKKLYEQLRCITYLKLISE
ncbi:hypothetical protein C1646_775051 [Rhizophagus diaphanus]|nr:hypothetical protein C1646_775051 [Rhizophagus diaphanus] [Rhizophagus sp. MUCL 43196]